MQFNFDTNKNVVVVVIYCLTIPSLSIAIFNVYTIVKSVFLLLQIVLTNAIINKFIIVSSNIV